MKIFIIILFLILIVSMIFIIILKRNKKKKMSIILDNKENYFPQVQIVEDDEIVPVEKNKIKNLDVKNAISKIDNYLPKGVLIKNNVENATEILKEGRAYFSAAKDGVENMLEVNGSNEVYGIQMKNKKFNKQTKFLNETDIIQEQAKNELVNAGFSAASMIVGQYYMDEINNKLEDISESIDKISEVQDSEYTGKIGSIITKVREVIEYKDEILNNKYSRDKRYDEIMFVEKDCKELLGEANDMINKILKKNNNINYEKYIKEIKNINTWFVRQQLLQDLLLQIDDIRYVLANGNESAKLSHNTYNKYAITTNQVNNKLENWNKNNIEKFGIDIQQSRKNGKLYFIRKNTIGKIKEEWAYDKVKDKEKLLIGKQINIKEFKEYNDKKRDEVIKIQRYKGEYYNLLAKDDEE